MFGSTVIEVGVGMALLFLFASLIATAAQETLEWLLQRRGIDLERGIRELLNDSGPDGLTRTFYSHPLIASLYPGQYRPGSRTLPSYIPSANFALALLDHVARGEATANPSGPPVPLTVDSCRSGLVQHVGDPKLRRMVLSALDTADGDLGKAKATLQAAFDATMDRVSGWYKRRTQRTVALIGLLAAVGLNIDAITVAQRLARDDALRRSVIAASEALPPSGPDQRSVGPTIAELSQRLESIGYPIGWAWDQGGLPLPAPQACQPQDPDGACTYRMSLGRWLLTLVGWLITALAVTLGAPFWFDVLNKIMVIRATVKPNEKSRPEASEDRQQTPRETVTLEVVARPG